MMTMRRVKKKEKQPTTNPANIVFQVVGSGGMNGATITKTTTMTPTREPSMQWQKHQQRANALNANIVTRTKYE